MLSLRDVRKIKSLDGLYYSFELIHHHYYGLYPTCCEIPADNSKLIPVINSCWGFVDALFRVREIAQAVPGLNKKHQEMRVFLRETQLAEEYRHYIQHLRTELAKKTPNTSPVWGSISWVDAGNPERSYTALFGARLEGTKVMSCVFDTVENRWVSKVCLSVNQTAFNFDPIFAASNRFEDFIIPFLLKDASEEVKSHNQVSIFTVDIR